MISFKEFYLAESKFFNWEEYVEKNVNFKDALEVLKILDGGRKYTSLIVGGAVRDAIMGNEVNDIDIATNRPIEEVDKLFPSHDIGKNKQFSITVIEYKGNNIEVSNFRKDSDQYTDGRHPDTVTLVNDFKEDSNRRDFRINSLGIDKDGNIIDHHGGIEDIKNKIISTVGDAQKRFSEDFLRMLRAVRFSARMGFKIDPETLQAIKDNASKIKDIAPERIFKEVFGMAKSTGNTFASAIRSLKDTGLLLYVFPELKHETLSSVLEPLKFYDGKDPMINLAILLHSLTTVDIERLCSRLKLDTDQKQTLLYVVNNYNKLDNLLEMDQKQIMDLAEHKYFNTLFNVYVANSKVGKVDESKLAEIVKKIEHLKDKFKNDNSIQNIKKVINGEWVMKILGIKPGPQLGKILNSTINWVINNDIDINDLKKIEDHIRNENI